MTTSSHWMPTPQAPESLYRRVGAGGSSKISIVRLRRVHTKPWMLIPPGAVPVEWFDKQQQAMRRADELLGRAG